MFQIDAIGAVKCPTVQLSDALGTAQIEKKDENLSERQATADLKAHGEYGLVYAYPIMVILVRRQHGWYTPFAESNGWFFPDTKIYMMLSSNLYNFWWVHSKHASDHFACKIYWLNALTRSTPGGQNAVSAFFFESSLNIIVIFLLKLDGFKGNFLKLKLDTCS